MLAEKSAEDGFSVVFIKTTAPEEVLKERLVRREKEGTSVSDAGPDMLEKFTADFEEPGEVDPRALFEADTDSDHEETLARLLKDVITAGISSP